MRNSIKLSDYFNSESRLNKLDKSTMIKINNITHYKIK